MLTSCTDTTSYRDWVHITMCKSLKVVKEIGTCNKDGRCSVKYTDETFGSQYLPIMGKEVGVDCIARVMPPNEVDKFVAKHPDLIRIE